MTKEKSSKKFVKAKPAKKRKDKSGIYVKNILKHLAKDVEKTTKKIEHDIAKQGAKKKAAKSSDAKAKTVKKANNNPKKQLKQKPQDMKELLLKKTDEKIAAKKKHIMERYEKEYKDYTKIQKESAKKPSGKNPTVRSKMPTAEEIKKKIEEYKKGKKPMSRIREASVTDEKEASVASEKEAKNFRKGLKEKAEKIKGKAAGEFVKTGVPGFDNLLEEGIPRSSSLLVAGGPGTGKTIFCLQLIADACKNGKKAIYISFEENEDNLKKHMTDFGWTPDTWIKENKLLIKRVSPYELSRSVEALLAKAKGELLIEFNGIPAILPKGFKPDLIVVDSLTAVAAAFVEKEDTYRIYIEQFFRLLEKVGATSFLITETADTASTYSKSGVEEFLADGVIAMYHIRKENVRVRGIEIIKLRGVKHVEKLVPFDIVAGKGIVAYPEEEIFV